MEKVKVLMFVANTNKKSGVATVIMNYYSKIYNEVVFDFLHFEDLDESNYNSTIIQYGGKVTKICSPYKILDFQKELKNYCLSHRDEYDFFHYHTPYLGFMLSKVSDWLGNVKIIAHAHVTQFGENRVSYIRNCLATKISSNVPDFVFACSVQAGIYNFGKKFTKSGFVMNNAIELRKYEFDCDNRSSVRKELGVENNFVIGHVGNFTPQKNHSLIIEIFAAVIKRIPNAKLVLVGEGYLKPTIMSKVKQSGLDDKVLFLGVRNDVERILSALDYFVFPSLFEGLGIALIEAQANGLKSLISDCIPAEAKVCNVVEKSLADTAVEWSLAITEEYKRDPDAIKKVKDAGFDLETEAYSLVEKYRSCLEG